MVLAGGAVQSDENAAPPRREMSAQRGPRPEFDFGPGRSEWETTFGTAAERIAAWLPTLPEGVRRHAQAQVYHHLRETSSGPYDTAMIDHAIRSAAAALPGAASP